LDIANDAQFAAERFFYSGSDLGLVVIPVEEARPDQKSGDDDGDQSKKRAENFTQFDYSAARITSKLRRHARRIN